MALRFLTLFLLLIFGCNNFAQNNSSKELGNIYLDQTKPDSVRVDAAIEIANNIFYSDIDSTQILIEQAKTWSIRSNYKYGLARVNGFLGYIYHVKGEYAKATDYYVSSINYNLINGFDLERAMDLGNYGSLLGEFKDPKALDCYKKSIAIYEEYDKTYDLVFLYAGLGDYYRSELNIDSALTYLYKAYRLSSDQYSKMVVETGLAQAYSDIDNIDSMLHYSDQFYPIAIEYGDTSNIRAYFQNMMSIKYALGQLDSAVIYGKKAEAISSNVSYLLKDDFYFTMSRIYKKKNDFKEAFRMLDSAFAYREYKHDEDMNNMIFREALNFEFNEKHLSDSLNYLREQEIKDAEYKKVLEHEAQMRYVLYGGIGMVSLIFLIVYFGYRRKQRDNELILRQKKLVEQKNQEVSDSIQYAKRIQSAILPSRKAIDKFMPNSFILYLPKDIVAGDFYWIEPTDQGLLFAAADCTGHGVPGAMVSVICNNALNRAVREYGLRKPGDILDKVKSIIIAEFEKSEDEVYDGMDIALCKLNGNKLEFSGAHNPLWIIRNNELIEIKADVQCVGNYPFDHPFNTHEFEVKKNDLIYLFTDGFADQFGGKRLKKFNSVRLKELFLEMHQLPLDEQKLQLHSRFEEWRGDEEQIDDICIVALKV